MNEKIRSLVSTLYKLDGKPLILTDSQCELFEIIFKRKYPRVQVMAYTRYGKLISDNTPVLTEKGWKKHGELTIEDKVFNEKGQLVKVLNVLPKGMADRKVIFSNGAEIKVNQNHEWKVKSKSKRPRNQWLLLETKEIEKYSLRTKKAYNFVVPLVEPLQFEKKNLPIDSYTLGAWLGDGVSSKPSLTISPKDKAIIDKIPYKISSIQYHKQTGVGLYNFYRTSLLENLRALDLIKNKHIPNEYLFSSIGQRLELLAGLIDTDGSVRNGQREDWNDYRILFTNANKTLIESVKELIRGLGMRTSEIELESRLSSSGIQGRQKIYVLSFTPRIEIPTVLERKKIKVSENKKSISIVDIQKIEPEQGNCITVEGGIYLVGKELIPTHNSLVIALAVLTRIITFPEKWAIVAGREKQARIIISYIIEHTFDNPMIQKKLELDPQENLDRLRRERSKNRLVYKNSRGGMGEVFILTGDSKNKEQAGNSLMGFGCIPAGFKVITDKGKIDIKEIVKEKINCRILSFNHRKNKKEWKNILNYQENKLANRDLIKIDLGDRTLQCTNDHPVYIEGKGYIRAEEVKMGDGLWLDK